MSKKTTPTKSTLKADTAVVIPASTGSGVTSDANVVDALKLGEHQNDDLAGDLAASTVTRPVVAAGAIVEPVNPALATEPAITGDAAGDAAIVEAGAAAGVPLAKAEAVNAIVNNKAVEPAVAMAMVSNAATAQSIEDALAETGCSNFADLVDMALVGMSLMSTIDIVTRDGVLKDWSPAEDPAEIVTDLLNMLDERGISKVGETTETGVAQLFGPKAIRISSAIDGFRRAGIAHTKAPVEYPAGRFTQKELQALIDEPNLTVEAI